MPPADELELTDPRAMRALAHPARLGILELSARQRLGHRDRVRARGRRQPAGGQLPPARTREVGPDPAGRERRRPRDALGAGGALDPLHERRRLAAVPDRRPRARRAGSSSVTTASWTTGSRPSRPSRASGATRPPSPARASTSRREELTSSSRRFRELMQGLRAPARRRAARGRRRVHVVFRAVPRVDPPKTRRK